MNMSQYPNTLRHNWLTLTSSQQSQQTMTIDTVDRNQRHNSFRNLRKYQIQHIKTKWEAGLENGHGVALKPSSIWAYDTACYTESMDSVIIWQKRIPRKVKYSIWATQTMTIIRDTSNREISKSNSVWFECLHCCAISYDNQCIWFNRMTGKMELDIFFQDKLSHAKTQQHLSVVFLIHHSIRGTILTPQKDRPEKRGLAPILRTNMTKAEGAIDKSQLQCHLSVLYSNLHLIILALWLPERKGTKVRHSL